MTKDMKYSLAILCVMAMMIPGITEAQRKTEPITRESILNEIAPSKESKEAILDGGRILTAFERKKFRYGISFNGYWSKILGTNLPEVYYWKPSIGSTIQARYNFKEWIGVSVGVGFQQSGGGIINHDVTGGAFSKPWIVNRVGTRGDPDSTYLQKLRFNNIDAPILLELRTKRDVLQPGWRLSGSIGVNVMNTMKVNKIWQSVVDGFHDDHYMTANYNRWDLGMMAALGFDVDPGSGQMFQCQFVWMKGTRNIYKVDPGDGKQSYLGLKFIWYY